MFFFHEESRTFHLQNHCISYVMRILPNGQPGQLYFGKRIRDRKSFDHLLEGAVRSHTAYPVVSMGSHVSAVPNHQMNRVTPLKTRAQVAYFGTFGYELDLNTLSEQELEEVRGYTAFMKKHRRLLQFGTFYRLQSPFTCNEPAWMVVSEDRREAIVGSYRLLSEANVHFSRLRLQGLDKDLLYHVEGVGSFYGDELMYAGLVTSDGSSGKTGNNIPPSTDFDSHIYVLKAAEGSK